MRSLDPKRKEENVSIIYIVSFAPANDSHGVGGFHWFPDKETAEASYSSEVQESVDAGGSHIVRLLCVDNPVPGFDGSDEMREQVTVWVDSDLDRWEFTEDALAQYIPDGTAADRIPSGEN